MTIATLARLASTSATTIYLVEAGRSVPRVAIMRRIAAVLGLGADDVAEFRDSLPTAPAGPVEAARRLEGKGYPTMLALRAASGAWRATDRTE